MSIDKSWMDISDRRLPEYEKGVNEFLEFAFSRLGEGREARCPCRKCNNNSFRNREMIFEHLMINGIKKDYRQWFNHGEKLYESDEESDDELGEDRNDGMRDMLYDFGSAKLSNVQNLEAELDGEEFVRMNQSSPNKEADKFYRLLKEVQQELYPGCESFSKLSFIVELMNIKCLYGWSGKSVDALLTLLSKAFPCGNKVPLSYSEGRKVVKDLGLDYVKIDACTNDCILYRGRYAEAQHCPVCGVSRWKNNEGVGDVPLNRAKGKNIPHKILRYFPLTPRLQMLYMSSKIASEMRWHKENLHNDENMRHPADSIAWKDFDSKYPSFAADPRNVRLGLASDGFNPFGNMSTSYSIWPVVLVPYNLPPWMCMKEPYFMMSLLIPGKKSPGNDIDVYLQPLIDELKELWENGVETYDASSKGNFQLRAAVLWTINDFPAYANLSGWSTKGSLACPSCNLDTWFYRLRNGHKTCYMGHRRFLPLNHPWRNNAKAFDGKKEKRPAPKQLSGEDVVEQFSHFDQVTFGKTMKKTVLPKKRKRGEITLPDLGTYKKRGRGRTCNAALAKKKAKGKKLDIVFPTPYFKVCGKHAKLLKSEISVCVNQLAPLQVKKWSDMEAEDIRTMWRFLKDKLSLSQADYPHVMKQVQSQYRTRTFNLHLAYRTKKGRPEDVSIDDWEWLIENKWTTQKFKETSIKNTANRGKQESHSITGTKSIVQTAYEMRDPETKEWPNAIDVWKKIQCRSDGTWKVKGGEEILNKLEEVAETHQEEISSAPIPMVEHFALVFGRRSGYSRGVGSAAITSRFKDRQRIYAQAEAAQQRADELEKEVQRLQETNTQIQTELEDQRKTVDIELQKQRKALEIEFEDQRKTLETQRAEMQAELQQGIQREMSVFFERFMTQSSI